VVKPNKTFHFNQKFTTRREVLKFTVYRSLLESSPAASGRIGRRLMRPCCSTVPRSLTLQRNRTFRRLGTVEKHGRNVRTGNNARRHVQTMQGNRIYLKSYFSRAIKILLTLYNTHIKKIK